MGACIFRIPTDEVDSDGRGVDCVTEGCNLKLTSQFEHDGNTAASVVGSVDGCLMFAFIIVVVCPRTTVPVGGYEDTFFGIGIITGNDVAHANLSAVVETVVGILTLHGESETLEGLCYPIAALLMCFAVHGAGTEAALLCHVVVGTVFGEGERCRCVVDFNGHCCWFRFTCASQQKGC